MIIKKEAEGKNKSAEQLAEDIRNKNHIKRRCRKFMLSIKLYNLLFHRFCEFFFGFGLCFDFYFIFCCSIIKNFSI